MSACKRLVGHGCLVTGASTGIGRGIAERLLDEGAKVALVDVNEEQGQSTLSHLQEPCNLLDLHSLGDVQEKYGVDHVSFVHAEIGTEEQCDVAVKKAVETLGGVDVLVNNAARFHFGPFEESKDADWRRVFDTNVLGYSNMIKLCLPFIRESTASSRSVVNVASVSSFIAQPDMYIYNASKGAIAQLTRCLALDYAKENIRINAICPGAILTDASLRHMDSLGLEHEAGKKAFGSDAPMDRMGDVSEVASVAAFLASSDASFMTGTMIVVDGGATLD
eukprot:m.116469 g.116469  ORF g.116469 m.116469 type:complete len:278 (-) comp13612_c0_seq3:172-1005(-)